MSGGVYIALALGMVIGMVIRLSKYDAYIRELEERNRKLEAQLHGKKSELRKEKNRRYDAENDLEDAQEIIGYQRDKLYQMRHPMELKAYEVSE